MIFNGLQWFIMVFSGLEWFVMDDLGVPGILMALGINRKMDPFKTNGF